MKGDVIIMRNFEYVPKEEWKPTRDELLEIIHKLSINYKLKFGIIFLFNISLWAVANKT